jgi:hypothetical protein
VSRGQGARSGSWGGGGQRCVLQVSGCSPALCGSSNSVAWQLQPIGRCNLMGCWFACVDNIALPCLPAGCVTVDGCSWVSAALSSAMAWMA